MNAEEIKKWKDKKGYASHMHPQNRIQDQGILNRTNQSIYNGKKV